MTLVEFLRVRLRSEWAYAVGKTDLSEQDPIYEYAKIAARRTIASVKAQGRIVDLHCLVDDVLNEGAICAECVEPYPCPTLELLALPYADHPDYDESWRP